MTEKEKYLNRIKDKQAQGLKDVAFTLSPATDLTNTTEEELYAELNRMEDAPDSPDPEVLGKYCPSFAGKRISREQALEGLGNPEDWRKEEEELNKDFKKKR